MPRRDRSAAGVPAGAGTATLDAPAGSRDTYEPPQRLTMVVGIDPGDVHCGVAVARVEYNPRNREGLIRLTRSVELPPDECCDQVAAWLLEGWVDALAVERFALYGDKAMSQVGSQMETAQTIGVLRYITRLANRGRKDDGLPEVPFALQGADIKKGIRAQMKARSIDGIPATADHERDAQLHAVYYSGKEVLRWGT